MISIEQLNGEIAALETEKPTFAIMARLADLYCVRDHISIGDQIQHPTATMPSFKISGDSEFAAAFNSADPAQAAALMCELMDALSVMQPALYRRVIRELSGR